MRGDIELIGGPPQSPSLGKPCMQWLVSLSIPKMHLLHFMVTIPILQIQLENSVVIRQAIL